MRRHVPPLLALLAACAALVLAGCASQPLERPPRPAPRFAAPPKADTAFAAIEQSLRKSNGDGVSGFEIFLRPQRERPALAARACRLGAPHDRPAVLRVVRRHRGAPAHQAGDRRGRPRGEGAHPHRRPQLAACGTPPPSTCATNCSPPSTRTRTSKCACSTPGRAATSSDGPGRRWGNGAPQPAHAQQVDHRRQPGDDPGRAQPRRRVLRAQPRVQLPRSRRDRHRARRAAGLRGVRPLLEQRLGAGGLGAEAPHEARGRRRGARPDGPGTRGQPVPREHPSRAAGLGRGNRFARPGGSTPAAARCIRTCPRTVPSAT